MLAIAIAQEQPDSLDAASLINELEAHLEPLYPSESRHGYSVATLLKQQVPFFVVRCDGLPAGCGGVQLFGTEYGELKRMYVRPQFRGRGLAKLLLQHLADFALSHGIKLVRLETGIHQTEAIGLYERMGFQRTTPFGSYTNDPLSLYYEKQLG